MADTGISRVRLLINSLGSSAARQAYRARLVDYFSAHQAELDEDSRRRLAGNPLRILDSKNPAMQALIGAAPLLTEHLDEASREQFASLCTTLEALGIPYIINPRLVRGLDYYSGTVFEWVTDALGAQDAVCAGGRYDGLIELLGGEPTPGIGCAMGIERVAELLTQAGTVPPPAPPAVYLIASAHGPSAKRCAWLSGCARPCQGEACW